MVLGEISSHVASVGSHLEGDPVLPAPLPVYKMDPQKLNDFAGRLKKAGKGGGIGVGLLAAAGAAAYGLYQSMYTGKIITTGPVKLNIHELHCTGRVQFIAPAQALTRKCFLFFCTI